LTTRTCPRCRREVAGGNLACPDCGQPLAPPRRSLAAWSKLLSLWSVPLLCAFGIGIPVAWLAVLLGIAALVRAAVVRSSEGVGQAVFGIVVGIVPMTLAMLVSLPALIAARTSNNEKATIVDLRAILEAEVAYAQANADLYDTLDCLVAPVRCIPGYAGSPPSFLAPELTATQRMGYRRTFRPGPAPKHRPAGTSPSSLTKFAVVAVPVLPNWTGRRAFCVDGSGRMCALDDAAVPAVVDGACAATCPDYR